MTISERIATPGGHAAASRPSAPPPASAHGGLGGVETRILAGFVLALTLLVLGGGYTYRATVKLADAVDWVAHTQAVRATLADLYGALAGADLAQRDYFLSPSPSRLDEHLHLAQVVRDRLAELKLETRANPAQRDNVAALESLVDSHLENMAAALVAYRDYGVAAARAVLAVGRLSSDTEALRALTERMDVAEANLLAQRQQEALKVRHDMLISLLATFAVASGLFVALFRGVRREMRATETADRQLRAANHFLDSLIESLPSMIFVKDAQDFRYVRQNRATLELLGLGAEDIIGKRDRDFLPAEQAAFIESKDREVLATGGVVEIPEQTIATRSGVRTLRTLKMPIRDEGGQVRFLLGISEDITERKLAEHAIQELNTVLLEKAGQLEVSNRELESFSYSVSHDLRAPLRAIDGFALMMEEDYAGRLDAEGIRYLAVIRENSRRMGALIDDLLAFSRLGRLTVTNGEINMDALVYEVIEELLQAAPRGADGGEGPAAHIDVSPLPPAQGDRSLLRQVWTNLISNALKYSSKQAEPRISIRGERVGGELRYSVVDNGVGFNMKYLEKLFRVFQRLHRADEFAGTGVGLAIVHRVVTRHGGRVWAEGKVGEGAVFSFALPVGDSSE